MTTTLRLHDGTELPAFGLGTWLSEPEQVYRAVRYAIEIGYRHIDGAWIYLNEEEVGRGVREAIEAGDAKREELWITTKLWNDHHAPEHVRPGLERSLKLLGLDYVDLYLVHWPVAHKHGVVRPRNPAEDFWTPQEMPLSKTWEAMAQLPDTGLAKQVGVSNCSASKIQGLIDSVGVTPAVDQVELHPFNQQNDLLVFLRDHGIVPTAYAPLGSRGRPAALRADDEVVLMEHPAVQQVAESVGKSPAQVLIAWGLARGCAVIPKSTNPERIKQNLEGASVSLEDEHLRALDALEQGTRYVSGRFWCPDGSPYSYESLWE